MNVVDLIRSKEDEFRILKDPSIQCVTEAKILFQYESELNECSGEESRVIGECEDGDVVIERNAVYRRISWRTNS